MKRFLLPLLAGALFASCGESSKKYDSSTDLFPSPPPAVAEAVVCPMCGGSGRFEYMPGDVMAPSETCPGCQGQGRVTAEQAQQIMEAQRQADATLGGGGGYSSGSSGYSGSSSGKSVEQLQRELQKAYELLEGMIRDRDACTSVTLRPQYDQMIVEQQQLIERLEAELRAASY